MSAVEPLMALLAFFAPLALAGVLVEWMARRQTTIQPKAAPAAGAPGKGES
jgi:hypothetical protein